MWWVPWGYEYFLSHSFEVLTRQRSLFHLWDAATFCAAEGRVIQVVIVLQNLLQTLTLDWDLPQSMFGFLLISAWVKCNRNINYTRTQCSVCFYTLWSSSACILYSCAFSLSVDYFLFSPYPKTCIFDFHIIQGHHFMYFCALLRWPVKFHLSYITHYLSLISQR